MIGVVESGEDPCLTPQMLIVIEDPSKRPAGYTLEEPDDEGKQWLVKVRSAPSSTASKAKKAKRAHGAPASTREILAEFMLSKREDSLLKRERQAHQAHVAERSVRCGGGGA